LLALGAAFVLAATARAGITIHYEGIATSAEAVDQVIAAATAFAKSQKWRVEPVAQAKGQLERANEGRTTQYEGKVTGVILHVNDDCEPIHLEFGSDRLLQDNVKTQFAGAAVHIKIIELLESLRPHFSKLEVDDEGDYWETHDRDALERRIDEVNILILEQKKADPDLRSPYRLGSGRIADVAK
jgi:hypothetical protein